MNDSSLMFSELMVESWSTGQGRECESVGDGV